jgi:predicted flap endonuclease-1-like 5' DNA nuclease
MYVTAASAAKAKVEAEPEPTPEPEPDPEPEAAEAAPEPELEPVTTAEPPKPDDLKQIEGIGPKVAELLNAAGITTFAALAETGLDRLNQILDEAKLQYMEPDSWPEQAALAARGDWKGFEKLTAELKGGRQDS